MPATVSAEYFHEPSPVRSNVIAAPPRSVCRLIQAWSASFGKNWNAVRSASSLSRKPGRDSDVDSPPASLSSSSAFPRGAPSMPVST